MVEKILDLRDVSSLTDCHSETKFVVTRAVNAASAVEVARPLLNLTYIRTEEGWIGGSNRKGKHSALPKQQGKGKQKSVPKITPSDEKWPKDLVDEERDTECDLSEHLSEVMDQGDLDICWAIALCGSIEAALRIADRAEKGIKLSPQHLVNNINHKNKRGMVKKFEEVREFLQKEGLVSERTCPFVFNRINPPCSHPFNDGILVKISTLTVVDKVDEVDLIKWVKKDPQTVLIEICEEFLKYIEGIYEGPKKPIRGTPTRHAGIVYGYGTTPNGVHYWRFQNPSWASRWGKNGHGKFIRQCSRRKDQKSLFVTAIYTEL